MADPAVVGVSHCGARIAVILLTHKSAKIDGELIASAVWCRYGESPEPKNSQGQTNMEWEEALLRAWGEDLSQSSPTYYRQKAARVREMAGAAATRAVKTRLFNDARRFDEIARSMDLMPTARGGM